MMAGNDEDTVMTSKAADERMLCGKDDGNQISQHYFGKCRGGLGRVLQGVEMNSEAKVAAVNIEIERMVCRHLGRTPPIDNNPANLVVVDNIPGLTYAPYANGGMMLLTNDSSSEREDVGRPNVANNHHDMEVTQITQNNPNRSAR